MFQMSHKTFFPPNIPHIEIFPPYLRLSEYFLNIYDMRIPRAPWANCGILILEQIQIGCQTGEIFFLQKLLNSSIKASWWWCWWGKAIAFQLWFMSTSIFLETAKHERPNIYVAGWLLSERSSAKVILLILKGKLSGKFWEVQYDFVKAVMTIRTRRRVAIRRSISYLLVSNDLCQHW